MLPKAWSSLLQYDLSAIFVFCCMLMDESDMKICWVSYYKKLAHFDTLDSKQQHEDRQTGQLLYHNYIMGIACCVCGLQAIRSSISGIYTPLSGLQTQKHCQHLQVKYRW